MGIDPVWQRIVLPSTACLRLGVLLAIASGGFFHLRFAPAVQAIAVAMAAGYAVVYAAVWRRRLPAEVPAYGTLLDAVVLGGLLAGSGSQAAMSGFFCLLSMALAHMCGGVRLALAALVALAAGWAGVHFSGVEGLVASTSWGQGDFRRLWLDAETTYGGQAVVAATDLQIVRAALACFFLISLSGCVAFTRAQWERRRVARACAEVDALEAIVDCYTSNASVQELWQTVSRSASQISAARVLAAYADGDFVQIEGTEDGSSEEDALLRGLRVPLSARGNLIVHSILTGREAETDNVADLCEGGENATAATPRRRRRLHYVVVPLANAQNGAALVAVVHGNTNTVMEGLRMVAERAGLVLRARESLRTRFDFEPAPAGA